MTQELLEGVYIIPKHLRVEAKDNVVRVLPRKIRGLKEYRCRDCEYRQKGYPSSTHKTMVCVLRPKKPIKTFHWDKPLYYYVREHDKICEHFKLKEKVKNEETHKQNKGRMAD